MAFALLIAGPTASGKSALAMARAALTDGLVVNADSMQVYADLRVLSARPDAADEARVPHRLYGIAGAREEFSVGRWLAAVAPLLDAARRGGNPLVIVGGTGLYFRALTEGLVETPPVPEAIRAEWRARAAAGADLHAELAARDPARAAALAPADTPRLLRALELHAATGRRYSDWLAAAPGRPLLAPGEWRGVFLDPDRAGLHAAIDRRFVAMVAAGALEEVRRLAALDPPLPRNLGVMKAHGVPHLADHLAGRIDLAEAIRRGQADTRRYARRQVIFARKYLAGPGWRWCADAATAARSLDHFDD
ncbi:tRNA (adenosine(37)-N6)-dimethylallyltransferase MiaA [Rhabdaerophilum calidifontis]|uniref:tRNA (adenosine(37)-N6)-dimethylallyltransferase MiaA n=1 Tax=Rhabdaerophilum calidifontis TaxID=2604328 RepID=UPI00123BE62A|nr:tRNA (adenosine(37)-N6)-dimethylallyltransferase MiaA [Rhabdaerophilum calidifontis]